MMSRAPKERPASRLIHSVDQSWNQASKYIVTTVVGREEEAHRFLANLIPELLYIHGEGASKWFTSQGLNVYKDVKWNPKKGTTSSSNARASADMVEEDLWDLSAKWKTLAEEVTTARPDISNIDKTNNNKASKKNQTKTPSPETPPLSERLASDKSVASFGATFGRELDSDDEKEANRAAEAASKLPDLTGTQFVFSAQQLARANEKSNESDSDGRSMSTAGKTTASTRLHLKEAQEKIAELEIALKASQTPLLALPPEAPPDSDDAETLTTEESLSKSPPRQIDNMDTEEPTDRQLLVAGLKHPMEVLQPDSDDMEEEQHTTISVGANPPQSSSNTSSNSSSSPSSSSTSSSDDTSDTQELIHKLNNNQYHPLSITTFSKKLIPTDQINDSKSDFVDHQPSDQDSETTQDHTHVESYGKAGDVHDVAGHGV